LTILKRPKTLAPVIMALILSLLSVMTAPAAFAADGASISGTVTVPAGADLKSAYVAISQTTYPEESPLLAVGPGQTLSGLKETMELEDAPAPPLAFADVPHLTPFETEINWLASREISTGWPEPDGTKTYRPLTPVSRDAMAAFLHRLAGKPDFWPPPVSPFADLAPTDTFFKEIIWLTARNISTGWDEGNGIRTYRPGQPVSRDAMAAFMYRLADRPAFTPPDTSPFTDVSKDNVYYHEITWLAAQDISTGWPEADGTKTFRPGQPVNRDAMAAFIYRFNTKFSLV
jgi:hypothetical protein